MDFGIAQRTRSGQDTDADTLTRLTNGAYLGTLAYMSPEQLLYRLVKPSEARPELEVNGDPIALFLQDGFATIRRTLREGDTVGLMLPMPVRRLRSHEAVEVWIPTESPRANDSAVRARE